MIFKVKEVLIKAVIVNVIIAVPHHRLRRFPAPMGADMWYKHC
jgi:hypothetical protein